MRILVTGSEGYVGHWLVPELVSAGHQLVGFADRKSGLDVTDRAEFRRVLDEDQPDLVVHLAALYGRVWGDKNPEQTIHDNVTGTAVVAQSCAERGIRLLYTSTSEVYGLPRGGPATRQRFESDFGLVPLNMYGMTKLWGEQICEYYLPSDDLQIVRFNMLMGPGPQQVGEGYNALHFMISQALANNMIEAHKNTARSWLWAGDAVAAVRLLIDSGVPGTFNIAQRWSDNITANELASMIVRILQSKSEIKVVTAPKSVTPYKDFSTAKIRGLGWRPQVGLPQAISRIAKWLQGISSM